MIAQQLANLQIPRRLKLPARVLDLAVREKKVNRDLQRPVWLTVYSLSMVEERVALFSALLVRMYYILLNNKLSI
jgi:hypothetical protein